MKPLTLVPANTNLSFMSRRLIFFVLSAAMCWARSG